MKKMIIILIALMLISCVKETKKIERTPDMIQTVTDKQGNQLRLTFDNKNDLVIINLKDESAVLKREKTASGFSYSNENYELYGKGNDFTLLKNSKIIFEHHDEISFVEAKDQLGNSLNLTFNITQGTAKAYLNGGEEINLKEKVSASGEIFANEKYELLGKGGKYSLIRLEDNKILFSNMK